MSHEITETDATFSVREMPWMGLLNGQVNVLSDYPTRAEAQAVAHNWEPVAQPLYRRVPSIDADGNLTATYEEVEGYVAQERSDNGALIAATTDTLVTVTNSEMYDVAEAIETGAPDKDVMYETGGSLNGGKRVWLMMRLRDPLVIKGDPNGATVPYFVLQNNHDGKGSFRGAATTVRIVCANTVRAADLDAKARGTEFTFKHTLNVGDRVEEARQALAGWRESVEDYRLLAEHMLLLKVDRKDVNEFLTRFIPAPLSTMTSDRVKHNVEEARREWMGVYNSVTQEGITGTAWGLLQASSEWSEHYRRANSQETRFKRAMLESNQVIADAKRLALAVAR